MKYFFFFLILFTGCAEAKLINRDVKMSAMEGGDFTGLIEGCGHQLIPGYTYCRKTEGDIANDKLYFVGPRVNCKRDFCIEYKIYSPNGELAYGNTIPSKEFRSEVPWSKILKRDTFEIGDRGFWLYTYNIYWIDKDGHENVTISEGEIRMRVIRKEYLPLHEVVNDKNFVASWGFWTKNNELVRMTTGARTYVSDRWKR